MEHKNFTYSVKSRYNGTVQPTLMHPSTENVVEATEEMKEVLESMAVSDMAVAPSRV
ncbi:hypothetical protein GQ600_12607 [Phytophthora cactorum]|nr:hypothetical protein GQ600_12607 [Phytophthora cactorum]